MLFERLSASCSPCRAVKLQSTNRLSLSLPDCQRRYRHAVADQCLTCFIVGHDDKYIHIQARIDSFLDGQAAVSSTHVHATHPGDDVLQALLFLNGKRLKGMAESSSLQVESCKKLENLGQPSLAYS